jgi:hypothetical protein
MTEIEEYGIEWLNPADVRGSVTILGTGLFNKDKAFMYLELNARLPGGLHGKVVSRTITWSDWREEQDDGGHTSHLPRPSRIWEIDVSGS